MGNSKFEWNAGTVILYIIILIVILILFRYFSIKMKYKPIFDWWNQNGGSLYDKYFNIFAIMAAYDNIIFYYISSLSGTLINQINRAQIMFLCDKIFPLTITPGISEITQFVLPRHMTVSINFTTGDNDLWFNEWLNKNPNYDDKSYLLYSNITEPAPDAKGKIIYNVTNDNKIPDPKTNKIGVYPAPNDTTNWKYLFIQWGAKTWSTSQDGTIIIPSLQPNEVTEWLDCNSHPDNFLARYGILPDSPLVIAFINNTYNYKSLKLDAISFKNLIGASNPGGWIGYLNGMYNSNISYDDYVDILYTTLAVEVRIPKPKAPVSNDCDTASNVISSISTGLGPLGIGILGGPPGIIFGGLVGIGLAIAQGITTNNKCNTQKEDDNTQNS